MVALFPDVETNTLWLVVDIVGMAVGVKSIAIAPHLDVVVISNTARNHISVSDLHPTHSIPICRIIEIAQLLPGFSSPHSVGTSHIAIVHVPPLVALPDLHSVCSTNHRKWTSFQGLVEWNVHVVGSSTDWRIPSHLAIRVEALIHHRTAASSKARKRGTAPPSPTRNAAVWECPCFASCQICSTCGTLGTLLRRRNAIVKPLASTTLAIAT